MQDPADGNLQKFRRFFRVCSDEVWWEDTKYWKFQKNSRQSVAICDISAIMVRARKTLISGCFYAVSHILESFRAKTRFFRAS